MYVFAPYTYKNMLRIKELVKTEDIDAYTYKLVSLVTYIQSILGL